MKFLQIIFYHFIILCFLFVKTASAQIDVGSTDLSREIEKSLLFDRETSEKFDIYNDEYGSNKLKEPSMGSLPTEDEKKE